MFISKKYDSGNTTYECRLALEHGMLPQSSLEVSDQTIINSNCLGTRTKEEYWAHLHL